MIRISDWECLTFKIPQLMYCSRCSIITTYLLFLVIFVQMFGRIAYGVECCRKWLIHILYLRMMQNSIANLRMLLNCICLLTVVAELHWLTYVCYRIAVCLFTTFAKIAFAYLRLLQDCLFAHLRVLLNCICLLVVFVELHIWWISAFKET
jgi:hypothetical protein